MSPARAIASATPLFLLAIACGGCFTVRDFSALPAGICAPEPTAVVPVLPGQVRVTVGKPATTQSTALSLSRSSVRDHLEVARVANEVFDTLCRNTASSLLGPSRTRSLLERAEDWENLHVYLDDPGPIDEPWKRQGLGAVSRGIGHRLALRVRLIVQMDPNISTDPWTEVHWLGTVAFAMDPLDVPADVDWSGTVTLAIDLLDLPSGRVVDTAMGQAEFHGSVGAIKGGGGNAPAALPYAFGKGFPRAVDQAARQALKRLYAGNQPKGGRP